MDNLIALHLTATLFMTGLIWFVQIVHYPLFLEVPDERRVRYCLEHTKKTTSVVLFPMFIELGTGLWIAYSTFPSLFWIGQVIGLGGIWLSTAFLQIPNHNILVENGDKEAAIRLVKTNWIRTVLWSIRSVSLVYTLIVP